MDNTANIMAYELLQLNWGDIDDNWIDELGKACRKEKKHRKELQKKRDAEFLAAREERRANKPHLQGLNARLRMGMTKQENQ